MSTWHGCRSCPEGIQAGLETRANFPLVNRAGETSIPGLYFAGAPTMISLGPGVRFISGTHHTAARLARSVARRAGKRTGPAEPADPDNFDAAASDCRRAGLSRYRPDHAPPGPRTSHPGPGGEFLDRRPALAHGGVKAALTGAGR